LETNLNILRQRYHQPTLVIEDEKVGKKSQLIIIEKWDDMYLDVQFKVNVSVDMKNVGIDQEGHPE
jgi:hypothetical protein